MRSRSNLRWVLFGVLCSLMASPHARAEFQFSDAVSYPVGFGAGPFAVGDFDGDNDLDVALGNLDFGTVSFLRNNGEGVLGSPVHVHAAVSVAALAVGDLEGDGDLDLIVADEGTFSKSIVTLVNDGSGTFDLTNTTLLFDLEESSLLHLRGIVLADFNGDALLDVAISCESSQLSAGFLKVSLNDGGGSFRNPATLPIGSVRLTSPKNLAAGDLTGEGRPCLVGINGTHEPVFFRSVEEGALQPYAPGTIISQTPSSVVLGDVDSDGDEDLVFSSETGGAMTVVFNDSELKFTRVRSVISGASRPGAPALGDFDGDGDLDLAVAEKTLLPNLGKPTIYLARNDGAGNFRPGLELGFGEFPSAPEWIESADLDGDGDLDLLATDRIEGKLAVHFNQRIPSAISSADQNGDGEFDLLDLLTIVNAWRRVSGF